ncbi:uncharacterized protein LOC129586497 [Paramacrobiotus metropolitanus]|uniref:uncharacterized protein LOC129586497 n=1 Tax=Paramacrobiotus metropolitanus TaxID=2943436 RepID=UPI0024458E84|nr:uncharacterized protein LOC129586497 [Paramacrobiotus metropolitanus]
MRYLKDALRAAGISEYEQLLYWTTFAFLFFGFFRIGEITAAAANRFDPQRILLWGDVMDAGHRLTVQLKVTKTDQTGQGSSVALTATGRSVCPVQAYRNYRARVSEPANEQPLLQREDGKYVTRADVEKCLRLLLKNHPERERFNTHSFRIGAATTAAGNNVPDHAIQLAGRWRSNCYTRYVRHSGPPVTLNPYRTG